MLYHPRRKELDKDVLRELDQLEESLQKKFFEIFAKKRKRLGTAYVWWFLASHYIYLDNPKLWKLYIRTGGGLLIWAVIDLFRMPRMIKDYNNKLAEIIIYKLRYNNGNL